MNAGSEVQFRIPHSAFTIPHSEKTLGVRSPPKRVRRRMFPPPPRKSHKLIQRRVPRVGRAIPFRSGAKPRPPASQAMLLLPSETTWYACFLCIPRRAIRQNPHPPDGSHITQPVQTLSTTIFPDSQSFFVRWGNTLAESVASADRRSVSFKTSRDRQRPTYATLASPSWTLTRVETPGSCMVIP